MDIPGAWVNDGHIVLWDIPKQPPGFVNITSEAREPGVYVFGKNNFRSADFPLINIFKRNVTGKAEEFLLGAISVMLITVLSELVQVILMQTRRRKNGAASRQGVQVAFLVDEFYHFRNVFSHVTGRKTDDNRRGQRDSVKGKTLLSVVVLCIGLALMAADVFAVYLTQPSNVYSWKENQYNLRGIQPIGTDQGITRWVTRLSRDRSCVTPTFSDSGQKREFSLSPCIMYDFKEAHTKVTDTIDEITVRSFFHRGGSDHRVTFGDAAISIRKRTYLYVAGNNNRDAFAKRLTFETKETEDLAYTKHLHALFIYSVLEVNCNEEEATVSCKERVEQLNARGGEHEIVEEEITFWRSRKKDATAVIRGVESRYRISLDNPFTSVDNAINALVVTSAIREVRGPGTYIDITSEEVDTDIRGLISEEGRVAGLVALVSIFGFFAVVLIVLRLVLRPVSLPELAWNALDNDSELFGEMASSSGVGIKESVISGDSSSWLDVGSGYERDMGAGRPSMCIVDSLRESCDDDGEPPGGNI